jgi:hypothetical protein
VREGEGVESHIDLHIYFYLDLYYRFSRTFSECYYTYSNEVKK